jgi:hypothetical protein
VPILSKRNVIAVVAFCGLVGEDSVFRPENGSYKLIARVQMEDWPYITAGK